MSCRRIWTEIRRERSWSYLRLYILKHEKIIHKPMFTKFWWPLSVTCFLFGFVIGDKIRKVTKWNEMASYSFITEQKHFWFDSSTAFVVIFPKTTIRVSFCEVLLRLGCVNREHALRRGSRHSEIQVHIICVIKELFQGLALSWMD